MAPRAPLPACGERQGEGLGEWPLCRREARPFRSIAQIAGSRRLGMKSGARRRNHWAASGGGAAVRGRRVIRFAAVGSRRSAARGGGGDGRTDRGPRGFRARWPVFKGLRDDFPPPRRAASASLASRCRPIGG
jgi:hypothetical protein